MSEHREENIDLTFGKAVAKGALIGLPIMLVVMTGGVFLITDQTLSTSISTGLLGGTLMGVFGGGFVGVLNSMRH